MTGFLSNLPTKSTIHVQKNTRNFFVSCILNLPESVREKMAIDELRRACGQFLLGFYLPPCPGTSFDFEGHAWEITSIHESVRRFRAEGQRSFPVAQCKYLGEVNREPAADE